ncbi:hypothetical protein [Thiomicrorhabdus cannonii]|uniref:hypothetical protein n=1 Tax=Thiomicrorhabdus cannonii TaxID=2748011 RepID=UPI0015BFA3F9|nr:hypothetical protein [Thiomicrorhabdus cannonii]
MNKVTQHKIPNPSKQRGFIVLMTMMMLAVGTAIWFGTLGQIRSNTMKIESEDRQLLELQAIKERMLAYAVLQPEIFSDQAVIPGVGYFPCPDTNGDGTADRPCGYDSATNQLFVIGRVPTQETSHFFSFIDSGIDPSLYWFAVDARLVDHHAYYAYDNALRFAPVSVQMPVEVPDQSNNDVPPLTVDGKDEIVMALFYAGPALSNQTRPSNSINDYLEQPTATLGYSINFQSVGATPDVFNDYVITITRKEWEAAMLARVSQDISPQDGVPDLCSLVAENTADWFNACAYTHPTNRPVYTCDGTAVNNLAGQDWRSLVCP